MDRKLIIIMFINLIIVSFQIWQFTRNNPQLYSFQVINIEFYSFFQRTNLIKLQILAVKIVMVQTYQDFCLVHNNQIKSIFQKIKYVSIHIIQLKMKINANDLREKKKMQIRIFRV
ncbi:unnamed protein product [Paramecium pentaurelia]|uniref:Transmembrane protein n=1 Tax=Paramecium pentaurelia TaxID=43138 RepID=A0A8S1WL68_9CILI|nr:unnamed protein product [Paramecium pentaurelia]